MRVCPKVTGLRVIARSETTWRSLIKEINPFFMRLPHSLRSLAMTIGESLLLHEH